MNLCCVWGGLCLRDCAERSPRSERPRLLFISAFQATGNSRIQRKRRSEIFSVSFSPTHTTVANPVSITQGSMQLCLPIRRRMASGWQRWSMGQQRHIFVMRTDGTEQRDLTPDNFRDYWPRWSPSGKRIAFSSRRTGDYELWVMNRDGSELRQLTQTAGGHLFALVSGREHDCVFHSHAAERMRHCSTRQGLERSETYLYFPPQRRELVF